MKKLVMNITQLEYLKPYIDGINVSHQITHLCVPELSSKCITEEFITNIKDKFGIYITIVPFDKVLFPYEVYDGIYLLIDCMTFHKIMEGIGTIQRHIKENFCEYKKLNPQPPQKCRKSDGSCPTAISNSITNLIIRVLSNKRHKWNGEWINGVCKC